MGNEILIIINEMLKPRASTFTSGFCLCYSFTDIWCRILQASGDHSSSCLFGHSPLKEDVLDMGNLKSRVITWECEELVSDTMHT